LSAAAATRPRAGGRSTHRWIRLLAAMVALTLVLGGLLLPWPLLHVSPGLPLGRALAGAENAFAAFILAEMLFVPLEGWLGDLRPRRGLVALGAVLAAAGAAGASRVPGIRAQLAFCAMAGAGAGLLYGGTVAKLLKGFTDRKALALGVTAVASLAVIALATAAALVVVDDPGAVKILAFFGVAQAAVIVLATAYVLEPPHVPPEAPMG